MEIRRGDIFFANLNPVVGSEQGGDSSGSHLAERYREQAQPHDDRGGGDIPDQKGQTAYPC